MKKVSTLLLIFTLAFTFAFASAGNAFAADKTQRDVVGEVLQKTGDFLFESNDNPTLGSIGGEWLMYGFAVSEYDLPEEYVETYKKNIEDILDENNGKLPKYTDYSRLIITMCALGDETLDPYTFGAKKYNLVDKLKNKSEVVKEGIAGAIFALRALDVSDYLINEASGDDLIAYYIDYILNEQKSDGGWAISDSNGDSDLTAMAIQTLSSFRTSNKNVNSALTRAEGWMKANINSNAAYETGNIETCESTAQALFALTSLGRNVTTNSYFKKNGKTLIDALLTYYDEEIGAFKHTMADNTVNMMATEQAYYALANYYENTLPKVELKSFKTYKKTSVKAEWKALRGADGYQVQLSTSSAFSSSKTTTYTINATSQLTKTVSSLKKGKTYYVRVRAINDVCGRSVYGVYSDVKKVKR